MNCQELHQDIEKLKSLRQELEKKIDHVDETGQGKIETNRIYDEVSSEIDGLLTKYLDDFKEHNPEITKFQLGNRIEGLLDKDGDEALIGSIVSLDGNKAIINGYNGALYCAAPDVDGGLQLGKRIEEFSNEYGYGLNYPPSIASLGGDKIIVGGSQGMLHLATIEANGELQIGERIEGFLDEGDYEIEIRFILPLKNNDIVVAGIDISGDGVWYYATFDSDGRLQLGKRIKELLEEAGHKNETIQSIFSLENGDLVIGVEGDLGGHSGYITSYLATFDANGELQLGERIEGFLDKDDNEARILSIASLDDKNAIMGGPNGALYLATFDANGKVRLGKRIEGFLDKNNNEANVFSIVSLNDNRVIIGGSDGALYLGTIDTNGELQLGKRIEGVLNKYDRDTSIFSISSLSDGSLMIGGYGGALYHAHPLACTVEGLKQFLPDLVNQKTLR